ncbi:MAG: BolA family protein [Pseudomonadota bacterium]
MNRTEQIKQKLTQQLKPHTLEVINESMQHQGHGGYDEQGSHFAVQIGCEAFVGLSVVACHRLVYQALDDMLPDPIHALRIKVVK